MNKKRIILIGITVALVIAISGGLYYFLTHEDENSTLTLIEKQWIESNKNNVIDMSIINDIPILSYNGEGLIVDFLNSLNTVTNLSFNKVSYNHGSDVKTDYAFKLVDEVKENDIVIYEDNYVILTKDDIFYRSLKELNDLKIGVLNNNLDQVNSYIYDTKVTYQTFEDKNELFTEFDKDETELDAIVLLKTVDLKDVIEHDYHISYNITEMRKYVVLTLGQEEKLNNILLKYYNKWKSDNYVNSYNKGLIGNFLTLNKVDNSQEVKFRSKRYIYGFIDNAPYDTTLDNHLAGINNKLLSEFSDFTNTEISYRSYNNIEELVKALNTNEIDFFYGLNKDRNYALDVLETGALYDNTIAILIHASNSADINSIKSLIGKEVYVLNNSRLQEYLQNLGVEVTSYDNDKKMIKEIEPNSIIVMDLNNYNYHVKDALKDYIVVNYTDFTNNGFVVRDISDNKLFIDLLNFFVSFNNTDNYVSQGLSELLLIDMRPIVLKKIAVYLGITVSILLIVLIIIKVKPNKHKKVNFSKEDKLRYIDSLTSLKNRNYLNENIEKWDESEVYPQTIVIIDLNNIAYINDNYGHPEGDAVIEQAANILILNQLENTDIIRTNGNEFLIYMVGYDEKQVITYMRKLGKELKELSHGFGAAIGYSMITDAIKTIDDAINEATLDMRNNKEESNNQ